MMINEIRIRKRIGVLFVCSLFFIFFLRYFLQPSGEKVINNYESCLSRYESGRYRRESPHKPSSYLISRLGEYEALHTRCGPNTEAYKQKIRELKSGRLNNNHDDESSDCKYLVRIPADGLGNRMLSLASAFLYALLTNRVLLVYDNKIDMSDLFCEPFPETTWSLPKEFPLWNRLDSLNQHSPESYGNIANLSESYSSLSFIYLFISGGYNDNDKRFYCDQDHKYLGNISWVIMKSNFYFIPSLFLIPSFEQELAKLFPIKDTVFHFLGRYLFLPSNPVWDHITKYYQTYLEKSDEIIGIQIRVFDRGWVKMMFNAVWEYQTIPETVLSCSFENNVLPEINTNKSLVIPQGDHHKSIAVLVTSLTSDFFEKIEKVYSEHSTVDGTLIKVFHPSSEEKQRTEKKWHNMKAWADMYLLSLSDKLITSPGSTFGYVAQGLAGLTPWILHMPVNETVKKPPCSRALSMEPCFHVPPSYSNCDRRPTIDPDSVVSLVRRCEDITFGVKLVDPSHL
uniref:galactoside 2-alpha-L-fucosyltransferase-like n=1 Tax=Erigeron canadensis TaxID=72917 RepID=UPI001CB8AADE|nr:galactoside 2-alpha-L-fucosyltransferase-like [Erigeron canadensis]